MTVKRKLDGTVDESSADQEIRIFHNHCFCMPLLDNLVGTC